MTDKGKGKFAQERQKVKRRGVIYHRYYIYIPKDVAEDSDFPFSPGSDVLVQFKGKNLTVTPYSEEKPF